MKRVNDLKGRKDASETEPRQAIRSRKQPLSISWPSRNPSKVACERRAWPCSRPRGCALQVQLTLRNEYDPILCARFSLHLGHHSFADESPRMLHKHREIICEFLHSDRRLMTFVAVNAIINRVSSSGSNSLPLGDFLYFCSHWSTWLVSNFGFLYVETLAM